MTDFDDFERHRVPVNETEIFVARAGTGPPVLLLHGFPETHLMWHRVGPLLAERFTVVCADLRGYGSSGKPMGGYDHAAYAKDAMAFDMLQAMEALGFDRFSVAGHDRGGRVAYRLALNHPDRVLRLAVLDIVPTAEAFETAAADFASAFWPWSLLAQPEPLPERLVAGDPAAVVEHALAEWGSDPSAFPPEVVSAYVASLKEPATIHAICEEYRAAATQDRRRDLEDRRLGRRIVCPVLALWSEGGPLDSWYVEAGGPLGIWRRWAEDTRGRALAGGHFFPEQNHLDTAGELSAFFAGADRTRSNS